MSILNIPQIGNKIVGYIESYNTKLDEIAVAVTSNVWDPYACKERRRALEELKNSFFSNVKEFAPKSVEIGLKVSGVDNVKKFTFPQSVEMGLRVSGLNQEGVTQKCNELVKIFTECSVILDEMLGAILENPAEIMGLDEYLREDTKFMLEAVKHNGYVLMYVNAALRANKEFMLEAVKRSGVALCFASEALKRDREVVLGAVKRSGVALCFASEALKDDKEFMLKAMKESGFALQYASKDLRSDKEVVLEAVKESGFALQYASEALRSDVEVVTRAYNGGGPPVLRDALVRPETPVQM